MIPSSFLRDLSRGGMVIAADLNRKAMVFGGGGVTAIGTPGRVYGKYGGGASFNGSSVGFALPSFTMGPGMSFGIRARWTSTTASMTLMDFTQSAGGRVLAYARVNEGGTGKVNFAGFPPLFNAVSPASNYNDGLWHTIVCTWGRGGFAILHVDGVAVASASATVPKFFVYDARVGVERWFGADYSWFNGDLADPFICNTILTPQDARAYHALTAEYGGGTESYGHLVSGRSNGPAPHFTRRRMGGGFAAGAL